VLHAPPVIHDVDELLHLVDAGVQMNLPDDDFANAVKMLPYNEAYVGNQWRIVSDITRTLLLANLPQRLHSVA